MINDLAGYFRYNTLIQVDAVMFLGSRVVDSGDGIRSRSAEHDITHETILLEYFTGLLCVIHEGRETPQVNSTDRVLFSALKVTGFLYEAMQET